MASLQEIYSQIGQQYGSNLPGGVFGHDPYGLLNWFHKGAQHGGGTSTGGQGYQFEQYAPGPHEGFLNITPQEFEGIGSFLSENAPPGQPTAPTMPTVSTGGGVVTNLDQGFSTPFYGAQASEVMPGFENAGAVNTSQYYGAGGTYGEEYYLSPQAGLGSLGQQFQDYQDASAQYGQDLSTYQQDFSNWQTNLQEMFPGSTPGATTQQGTERYTPILQNSNFVSPSQVGGMNFEDFLSQTGSLSPAQWQKQFTEQLGELGGVLRPGGDILVPDPTGLASPYAPQ